MAPPPPRPPIICYDLQTNSNVRRAPDARYRVPLTGTVRKTRVTVVHRDANELKNARADAHWHQRNSYEDDGYENSENLPLTSRPTRPTIERAKSYHPHDKVVRLNKTTFYNKDPLESRPYKFNAQPLGTTNQATPSRLHVANARYAYGQKLKHDAEERERRLEQRRQRLAVQAQLDEISAQLESSKRLQENLLKTYGMSHNAARYIQHQDEENAKLRKKVDQIAETRSKELGKRLQQMKRFQELQKKEDKRIEQRRLEDTPMSTHCKHRWNSTLNNSISSTNSPTTNTATTTNTASPSSTISISSCSSPMSTDEQHIPSIHFVDPPTYKSTTQTTLPTSTILSSATKSKSQRDNKRESVLPARPNDKFSFYKGNPLEKNEPLDVTELNFYEKVEDNTMLEVDELKKIMQSALNFVESCKRNSNC